MAGSASEIVEYANTVSLIDNHCHSITVKDLTDQEFLDLATEAPDRLASVSSPLESLGGLALLQRCGTLLNLKTPVTAEAYLQTRRSVGGYDISKKLMASCGTSELYVDSGSSPVGLVSLSDLSTLSGAVARPIIRLETLAESVLESLPSPRDFSDVFTEVLLTEAADAVGLKSIAAYRFGLGLSATMPDELELRHAVEREFSAAQRRGVIKVAEPTILSYLVHQALTSLDLPVQFHVGFGEPNLQLDRVNPALLTPVIRRAAFLGRQIVLLHCYPYHREAAYLSHVFANVSFDLGLTLNFVGGAASSVLAEALELAPFTKLLYSSDAHGLAELHALGASSFRSAVGEFFGNLVMWGQIDMATAQRFVDMVAFANSKRVYQT